ncbi:MAG: SDR family NAD(P)-dependent oxidoreductase, partial [Gammaproteobacteria bacterium]|nr:SDR family NAD(P)-dependent oxidoreductase [Gammaproteobacteria bacterium]
RAYVKRHYKKQSADVFDVMACQQRLDKCIDHDACYETLHHHAYHYGPGFQGIQSLWISKTELLAEIELPEHLAADNETYYFHPSLFDACLQTVIFSEILRLTEGQELISRLPVAIKEIGISANAPRRFWCHTVISQRDDEKMTADITLYDEKQQAFGRINGFIAKTVDSVASGMTSRTIDQWLYHPDWQNKTIEEEDKVDLADCYLILADDKGTGLALAQSLRQQGAHVCLATAHGKRSQPANIDDDLQSATINPSELADNVQLLQALNARYKDFGIIHCIGLDSIDVDTVDQTSLNEYKERSIHSLLMLAKAIIQVNVGGKLWVITRNGLAIPQQTTTVDVLSASITGMSRVLAQQELVDVWGRLIDIDHGNNIDAIVNELGTLCADDEIAYRNNTRIASRLVAARDLQPPFPLRLNNNATYMVVGGFGAIGRLVCTMLVNRGARRLLITSRGSLPSRDHWQHMDPGHHLYERVQFVRSLEALGADVIVSDVDVCRERELTYFLETFAKQSYPDIRGVFFCAGIVKDAIVQNIDSRDFDDVYDTKSIGALALHRCVADYPLDHFVLFSSVAAQITTIGQTSYAAGNAFLDALCHHRHQQGLPALSINWGPWAIGMIKQLNLIEHYRSQRGISCILPEAGVKVMERILDQPHAQLTVCEANWAQVVKWYNKTPALFADLYDPADDQSDTGEGGFIDHYIQQETSDRVAFVCQNLRTVVSQVLRIDVEKVDVDLGLINLGIDSIMAAELSNRIKALFGHSLSLVKLIGEGRIIDLATELNDKIAADKEIMAAAQQTSAVTLEPVDANHSIIEAPNPFADIDVADEFPLSYGQKAIWFTHQLNPLSAAYNIGGVMHIPSQLNVEALEKAIRGVVQRHAGLRTNFFVVDGEPVQRVYASRNDNLELVNVHDRSWQDIRQMIIAENQKPFNLENEALYRIRLYQQSNDSYYFAISIYHIISDARSNYLFLNEMQDLYARYNNNENVSIEPVASNYNDFVQSENRLINSIRGSSMYKYWRKQLPAQIPQLALPLDKKRPDVMSNNGSSFDFEIDQDLTARLKVLSRQEGATMFMALMSVYYVLLHRYTEQDDIIIGSPVAGRTSPEFADIYGYFVNPLPLWQNFSDNPTYLQLLSRVKDNTLAALENQEFPFALLVDRLELEHDPSYSLVFQAMFVLLNHQVDRSHMDDNNVAHYKGFPMQLLQMPEEEGQFDITLSVYEENGVYQCTFKYNTDLFVPGTIENMAGHFIQLLQQSLSQPQKPVNDYSMLSDLEKNKVINEFSNLNVLRQRPDQEFVPVHQQFEQQARNNPEQTAIKMSHEDDGHESLSYQQLNIRANQLAHVLIDRGIQPGTIVAIYQHKSIDMMVSLLACLKAGAPICC